MESVKINEPDFTINYLSERLSEAYAESEKLRAQLAEAQLQIRHLNTITMDYTAPSIFTREMDRMEDRAEQAEKKLKESEASKLRLREALTMARQFIGGCYTNAGYEDVYDAIMQALNTDAVGKK